MRFCVFHKGCSDGITSAWVTKYFDPEILLIPTQYNEEPNLPYPSSGEDEVIFVDISPQPELLKDESFRSLKVFDHHESALWLLKCEEKEGYEYIIDVNKAACEIVWDYFFPHEPYPWFLRYVADRDTWRWQMPNSREINAALYHKNLIWFTKIDSLLDYNTHDINELIAYGKNIIEMSEKQSAICFNTTSKEVDFHGYNVWAVCCNRHQRSDVGEYANNRPLKNGKYSPFTIVIVYDLRNNIWRISLRAKPGSEIDLSKIAEVYGGGGHKDAAGFVVDSLSRLFDQ